jgi:hypothetical protein
MLFVEERKLVDVVHGCLQQLPIDLFLTQVGRFELSLAELSLHLNFLRGVQLIAAA